MIEMQIHRRGRITFTCLSYFQGSAVSAATRRAKEAARIAKLDTFFHTLLKDRQIIFSKAIVLGTTSVEGMYARNAQLAYNRARDLRRMLDRRYRLSQLMPVEVSYVAEDWDGLAECVRNADPLVLPQRNEILNIIHNVPVFSGRQAQLMLLDEGRPYRYMYTHFFPLQRRSTVTLEYDIKDEMERQLGHPIDDNSIDLIIASAFLSKDKAEAFLKGDALQAVTLNANALFTTGRIVDKIRGIQQTLLKAPLVIDKKQSLQEEPVVAPVMPVRRIFHPWLVVKTNLLADAGLTTEVRYRTPMPNLELEYLIDTHFSVALSGLYEKFSSIHGYDNWHVTAYTLEGRYRILAQPCYGGLYIGLYGRVGDYNFRKCIAEEERPGNTGRYFGVGLSAGYTLPLGNRWVLEGGAAAGYRQSSVKNYTHESADKNMMDGRTPKHTFGLGDLFVRIGYRFGNWRRN
jgi:hypothetical protein